MPSQLTITHLSHDIAAKKSFVSYVWSDDPGKRLGADVDSGAGARLHGVAHFTKRGELAHPMTRGTLKRPASRLASGALASAEARSSDVCTTSARSAS